MIGENNKPSLFNTLRLLQAYEQAIDENIISSITDMHGTIVHANQKFCEVSKYTVDEVIGKNHRLINSGLHPKEFFEIMWKTISNGDVWHNEIMNKAKDGSFYWVDTVIVPIKNDKDEYTNYLSLRTLITGRKKLEKENEAYVTSLQSMNNQLEKYSYIISHDLKAPLQKIAALTDMLLEEIKVGNTIELKKISNYIHQSISSAEKIITDTLEEAKGKNLMAADDQINLDKLLEEIQQIIVVPGNFKLTVNSAFTLIPGKKIQLLQILMNLITNAIKYNDKTICETSLNCKDAGNEILFIVTDNGKGISQDKIGSIFDLFNKDLDSSINSHGVGLNIVKSIVESRGGNISVTSQEGLSTQIKFTWPKSVAHFSNTITVNAVSSSIME